jgi:hypothetical protein
LALISYHLRGFNGQMGGEYGVLQMSKNFSLGSLLLAVDNNDDCPKL